MNKHAQGENNKLTIKMSRSNKKLQVKGQKREMDMRLGAMGRRKWAIREAFERDKKVVKGDRKV